MDNAISMENVFHEVMLRTAKGEEEKDFENARHEIMSEAIKASCNYYAERYCSKEYDDMELLR